MEIELVFQVLLSVSVPNSAYKKAGSIVTDCFVWTLLTQSTMVLWHQQLHCPRNLWPGSSHREHQKYPRERTKKGRENTEHQGQQPSVLLKGAETHACSSGQENVMYFWPAARGSADREYGKVQGMCLGDVAHFFQTLGAIAWPENV